MTVSVKVTCLAEMTSFPRKRESISVSESRNLSRKSPGTAVPVASGMAPGSSGRSACAPHRLLRRHPLVDDSWAPPRLRQCRGGMNRETRGGSRTRRIASWSKSGRGFTRQLHPALGVPAVPETCFRSGRAAPRPARGRRSLPRCPRRGNDRRPRARRRRAPAPRPRRQGGTRARPGRTASA